MRLLSLDVVLHVLLWLVVVIIKFGNVLVIISSDIFSATWSLLFWDSHDICVGLLHGDPRFLSVWSFSLVLFFLSSDLVISIVLSSSSSILLLVQICLWIVILNFWFIELFCFRISFWFSFRFSLFYRLFYFIFYKFSLLFFHFLCSPSLLVLWTSLIWLF